MRSTTTDAPAPARILGVQLTAAGWRVVYVPRGEARPRVAYVSGAVAAGHIRTGATVRLRVLGDQITEVTP